MNAPLPGDGIRPATIAFLGPPGTHSEEAVRSALGDAGDKVVLVSAETNREVVLAVEQGVADAAFVAIENSVEGAVTETLDALVHETPETLIVGELVWPVHHCLIAAEQVEAEKISTVASHPQALAQCSGYITERLAGAERVQVASTSEAVRDAVVRADGHAAIGSRIAAERYGGVVIDSEIEDVVGNRTRFVWLAKQQLDAGWLGTEPQATHKTSVVFSGFNDTSPGALVSILSEFAYRSVNLSKIESRPERTQLGNYLFFVDLDGSTSEERVADAIEAIRDKVKTIRVLGSFPAHEV
ncbi:MAG: prephenate dehydratase [Solirubrobacterales bacterium]